MCTVGKQPYKSSKRKAKCKAYLKYQRYIRSKRWRELRQQILERDGHMCRFCGRRAGDDGCTLTVHHISYDNLYKCDESEANDCITICSIDHQWLHQNEMNYKRFNVASSEKVNIV